MSLGAGPSGGGGGRRVEDEDSSLLKFGPGACPPFCFAPMRLWYARLGFLNGGLWCLRCADFSRAKALMNSEVAQILEHKRQIMQGKGAQPKRCVRRRLQPRCFRTPVAFPPCGRLVEALGAWASPASPRLCFAQ